MIARWRNKVMARNGSRGDRKRGNRPNVVNGGGKYRCATEECLERTQTLGYVRLGERERKASTKRMPRQNDHYR